MMENPSGNRSTVAIKGHPVHHLLIPFPIALFMGALASDSMYAISKDKFWSKASYYLVAGGLAGGAAAAATGLTDFITIRRARVMEGWIHLLGNAAVIGLATASLTMRIMNRDSAVVPKGLALQSAIGTLLVATSWYGGELAYRRRIGVIPTTERAVEEMEELAREAA
jgi:uncharacterized membrane protein